MSSDWRIIIIGAGPAGLTAALAGKRRGLDVTVYEQAPDFQRVGGGVLMHSNGLRVLDALGVLPRFEKHLRFGSQIRVEEAGGGVLFSSDYSQLPIPQNRIAIALRYQLQESLLEAVREAGVPIHFGHRCEGVWREGKTASPSFAYGAETKEAVADVLLACDGMNSRVRELSGMPFERVSLGEGWIRGVAPVARSENVMREIFGTDGRRFGIGPLPDGQTYFYAKAPLGQWTETIRDPDRREKWIRSYDSYSPDVLPILRSVSDWEAVNYSELTEIRMPRWADPPFFFVGDAAHAMTPNLGQGANSALVDAYILMELLAEAKQQGWPLGAVAERYDALRRPFVTRIQKTARQIGQLGNITSPPLLLLRRALFALSGRLPFLHRSPLLLGAGYNRKEESFFHGK
jgi:2-polyprenyl-6-methoxyphenol hydroxylase-like FAD-dependent oxidoreductase